MPYRDVGSWDLIVEPFLSRLLIHDIDGRQDIFFFGELRFESDTATFAFIQLYNVSDDMNPDERGRFSWQTSYQLPWADIDVYDEGYSFADYTSNEWSS